MRMIQETLPVFTNAEYIRAHLLLATRVAYMMGRKLEEADWANVYCAAKGIPEQGWSNLNIDVMHQGLGVEHKMLGIHSDKPIVTWCGTTQMHPSLTRSIRINSTDDDPNAVMRDVFAQYAELVEKRKAKVRETTSGEEIDMRIGWLLWRRNLSEFLYFEYAMIPPNPKHYWAKWEERTKGTSRKGSKNLWVYHKKTKQKRYSITTQAGVKIQPYFDVPLPDDPHLYLFTVQGELLNSGVVRIWVTASTARELERILGDLSADHLSAAIVEAGSNMEVIQEGGIVAEDEARSILLTKEAYFSLTRAFPGVSDEHRVQLFVAYLRER